MAPLRQLTMDLKGQRLGAGGSTKGQVVPPAPPPVPLAPPVLLTCPISRIRCSAKTGALALGRPGEGYQPSAAALRALGLLLAPNTFLTAYLPFAPVPIRAELINYYVRQFKAAEDLKLQAAIGKGVQLARAKLKFELSTTGLEVVL